MRDSEVRELADEAYRSALGILDAHRAELDALASRLLANAVLERGDINEVMGDVPSVAPPRIGVAFGLAAATAENPARPAQP